MGRQDGSRSARPAALGWTAQGPEPGLPAASREGQGQRFSPGARTLIFPRETQCELLASGAVGSTVSGHGLCGACHGISSKRPVWVSGTARGRLLPRDVEIVRTPISRLLAGKEPRTPLATLCVFSNKTGCTGSLLPTPLSCHENPRHAPVAPSRTSWNLERHHLFRLHQKIPPGHRARAS